MGTTKEQTNEATETRLTNGITVVTTIKYISGEEATPQQKAAGQKVSSLFNRLLEEAKAEVKI